MGPEHGCLRLVEGLDGEKGSGFTRLCPDFPRKRMHFHKNLLRRLIIAGKRHI